MSWGVSTVFNKLRLLEEHGEIEFCPFCELPLDHEQRCANVECFMWFTLVPLPDVRKPNWVVFNACGEAVFVA